MKVLFTYDYGQENMDKLIKEGIHAVFHDERDIDNYKDIEDVDVLVCYKPFSKINLSDYTSLKLILLSSIGFDQLPIDEIQALGITVCNNKGGYSIPMGEWIVMKLLEQFKHSKALYINQTNKKWQMDTTIIEMYKKTVVFFGTGTIAREAAKRLTGFDMHVIGLNTSGHCEEFFDVCYPLNEATAHINNADAVVVALPLTKLTRGIIGKSIIDALDKKCVLINIARGEVIDEPYLINALKNNKIRSAALDVFYQEPLPKDHALWNLENVIITCHNSWISEMRNERRFDLIHMNLLKQKNSAPLINVVNILKGY